MAMSPAADGGPPNGPPDEPEPACREAQTWIEAATGQSFGDKGFRGGLENGVLLCELLNAIKPGLIKKINRLQTPIAGLDNLSVFLRGCEDLGLKASQLFDPGDLQDTSTRAEPRDSDSNRKLKNVLNTVYWLGKAASGCSSYSGPTLNVKEFEGLLAQMRTDVEEGDSPLKRSVRDSGYDCWESERSESLSPRHTRDNSLDSLDSFGSRSQHSPSPDVVTRGNSDGRGSDSEADGPNRKPDVRRDDMLARRTAGSESRSSIHFNQFLPNRANAGAYIPTPRRRPRPEGEGQRSLPEAQAGQGEGTGPFKRPLGPRFRASKASKTVTWAPENGGPQEEDEEAPEEEPALEKEEEEEGLEQRRLKKLEKAGIRVLPAAVRYSSLRVVASEQQEVRSSPPDIILRRDNEFLTNQRAAWDSSSDGEGGEGGAAEDRRVPDVRKDDLATRRGARVQAVRGVHQFVPACNSKDRQRWEEIRRASQQALQEREASDREAVPDIITRRDNPFLHSAPRPEEEEDEEEEEGVQAVPNKQKDDLARRRAQSRPRPHGDGPMRFVSASMSQADRERWERLKMAEPSSPPVCQACLEKSSGVPAVGQSEAGRSKVVTFGGVTEIEQPIDAVVSSEGEESELLRRLLAKATVVLPAIGLSARDPSQVGGVEPPTPPPTAPLPAPPPPRAPHAAAPPAKPDVRLSQHETWRREEDEDEEDEDEEDEGRAPDVRKDDMMARRTGAFQRAGGSSYNHFLPRPAAKRPAQGELTVDAAPKGHREVQAERSRMQRVRAEQQQQQQQQQQPPRVATETSRRADAPTVVRAVSHDDDDDDDEDDENGPAPDLEKDDMMARRAGGFRKPSVPGAKQPFNQFLPAPRAARPTTTPSPGWNRLYSKPKKNHGDTSTAVTGATEPHKEREREQDKTPAETSLVARPEPPCPPALTPPPTPPAAHATGTERAGRGAGGGRDRTGAEPPRRRPAWQEEDDLPPMMMSRRVAFMSEDTESHSMNDMLSEEEAGYPQPLSQSRFERMQEQYNSNQDEDDEWQSDLARWKSRRRSASQDLIKKEEERKRMEKKMKEEALDGSKRKSIKTYKEIVEEKERREVDLCEAYRGAQTPEEAAQVLQRYALRFTISDATLDSLKLPRAPASPEPHQADQQDRAKPDQGDQQRPKPDQGDQQHRAKPDQADQQRPKPDHRPKPDQGDQQRPKPDQEDQQRRPKPDLILADQQQRPTQHSTDCELQAQTTGSELKPAEVETTAPPERSPESSGPPAPVHSHPAVTPHTPPPPREPEPQQTQHEAAHAHPAGEEDTRLNTEDTPLITKDLPPQSAPAPPQSSVQTPQTTPPQSSVQPPQRRSPPPRPPSRPVPLLTAKPYRQPQSCPPGHKPLMVDRCVRVNGEATEASVTSPSSPPHSPEATEAPPPEQTTANHNAGDQSLPPQPEKVSPPSGSAISNLIGGRNCIITTTIVTELKHVEPYPRETPSGEVSGTLGLLGKPAGEKEAVVSPSSPSSSSYSNLYSPTVTEGLGESSLTTETPMLNLAKRVNHWVWDPNEERKRQERWQQEQERLLQVQYQREQEKLKEEWERAQREAEEEERRHNEEERQILEETAAPLNPSGLAKQTGAIAPAQQNHQTGAIALAQQNHQTGAIAPGQQNHQTGAIAPAQQNHQTGAIAPGQQNHQTGAIAPAQQNHQNHQTGAIAPAQQNHQTGAIAPAQQNGQRPPRNQEGQQHASKMHFFQDPSLEKESRTPTQQLWKTSSLDRNSQLSQTTNVKRSGSHDTVVGTQQSAPPQPPSPSRCVSGRRQCAGCVQPLGKGAAMIIDTLGLFFHVDCFKCGVCSGPLGDTSAGTDVRIRNGLLSCHECYIASRGGGQPTTL